MFGVLFERNQCLESYYRETKSLESYYFGEGNNKFIHAKLVVVFIADASPKREDTYMVVAFMDHRELLFLSEEWRI